MTNMPEITPPLHRWRPVCGKLGLLILFVSLTSGLLLSCRLLNSHITGVFSQPTIDFVTIQSFTGLDCPTILNRNETATIRTTIANRSGEEKAFSIDLAALAQSESVPIILSGSEAQRWWVSNGNVRQISGTLAAGEVRTDSWQMRFPEGEAIRDVAVVAYVDNGNGLYWGTCGLVFTQLPGLTGGQISLIILGGIPLGALLWLYGRRP